MKLKFSPSVNIIRDEAYELNYIVTRNAKRVANEIELLSESGFKSFTIIGSYGSGKSSFLLAFEKHLKGEKKYFDIPTRNCEFLKLVGSYDSLQEILSSELKSSLESKSIFKALSKNSKPLVILIDEFGKFIEYAVRNEPEKEIYFLQQLAEYIADPKNSCVLITTLHQSFDAYSSSFLSASERNEWRKVKGRFKDLTFNEPVEQLLYLAATDIDNETNANKKYVAQIKHLQEQHNIVKSDPDFISEIGNSLWPLDLFSSYLLAVGLQRYGQNERSLFTFLASDLDDNRTEVLQIPEIYDYLHHEFYSFLRSQSNFDSNGWKSISTGLDKTEILAKESVDLAQDIIKIIGLVTILGHKGASLDKNFLIGYLSQTNEKKSIQNVITELEKRKIILFTKFNNSYRIIEGTDVDFASELKEADKEVNDEFDVVSKLSEHFSFTAINAKAVTYKFGTPRFFEYVISENPINKTPEGQIDGFINLVFNSKLDTKAIANHSTDHEETLFGLFNNAHNIKELLIDIERTMKAKARNHDDKVAREVFEDILSKQKRLLQREVKEALFTNQVSWIHKGKILSITSNKELNRVTSNICEQVYDSTPVFKNELINRFVLQGGTAAKKPYFKHLVQNYYKTDLGFSEDSFKPEKTIYLSLLKNTGIHDLSSELSFSPPHDSFAALWDVSEAFLESAKKERKKLTDLFILLQKKPFKLTPGFIDFWIPTYLFIRRNDFALFSKEEGYQPELTDSHLHFFTRDPSTYEIKTFDVQGIKLDLYNKYRELLQLKDETEVGNQSMIESLKPFMVFYHHLNHYAKTTNRITVEARALRQSIEKAKDPEKLFFEQFPKAMHVSLKDLLKNQKEFDTYIHKIREAIRDLQSCFDQLLDRIEGFLCEEILHSKELSFIEYKQKVVDQFMVLKEHMLTPTQSALLVRLRSPLEDRNSWLNSICQVVIGKSLDTIADKEEAILKEKLMTAFKELKNLSVLSKATASSEESMIKVDITSLEEGTKETIVRLPQSVDDQVLDTMNTIKKALGKKKEINTFILANLLKDQLNE